MANKPIPMLLVRRIIQLKASGHSNRQIARKYSISRMTVNGYVERLESSGKSYSALLELEDEVLWSLASRASAVNVANPKYADLEKRFSKLAQELQKPKVTRTILWEEYKRDNPNGYGFSQFCEHLSRYFQSKAVVMHLEHVAGEELYFDFAGDMLSYTDRDSGEAVRAPVFVAVLPFSGYTYVEVLASMGRSHLLAALANTLAFFGGVPQSLKSDNMSQFVKKANRYEPAFDELALQFGLHYNTTLLATRVRKPRDKAAVESTVNTAYHRIYPVLRHHRPGSLQELNHHVRDALYALNERTMQHKGVSRKSIFDSVEKPTLSPLPSSPFVPKSTLHAKVGRNYHVVLGQDKHHYSVPHIHVGQTVKIIYDTDNVEIYLHHDRIAVHRRSYCSHAYSTQEAHMPPKHRQYAVAQAWDATYFLREAGTIGPYTQKAIEVILSQKIFKEQTYNSCKGVLALAKKYPTERLEAACKRLDGAPKINYTIIQSILLKGLDKARALEQTESQLPLHDNVRGSHAFENQ